MAAVVISIALQKGGVGKSTTAQALASTLGFKHKKTLLIDMDSQANVTYASGIDTPDKTITDVLGGDCRPDDAAIKCKFYDILAADEYLTNVEISDDIEPTLLKDAIKPIKDKYDFIIIDTPPALGNLSVNALVASENVEISDDIEPTLLKDAIKPIKDKYDFIIIDTPPALGNLSVNALVASDYVVIPVEPRPFAMQGLGALHNTLQSVQNSLNPALKVLGILLIKYSNRTVLNRDIKDMIADYAQQMGTVVFDTTIREGIAVAEAQTMRKPLIDYAKSSKPNIDYKAFTTEVLKKIGE